MNRDIFIGIIKDRNGKIIESAIAEDYDGPFNLNIEDGVHETLVGYFTNWSHVESALENSPYTAECYCGSVDVNKIIPHIKID